ncbi:hypothetical protein QDA04_gp72 [Microbacterium phage Megan]|uniref:Uncharacterized protein n=1 Tax=Microbacterium phage Megan TaxID=2656551 RepID=A0A649VLC6_9CAUD|nr:hypothetical protein QDA04_gp72 [Microbacterium phage Megan]QGJ92742.1 hypothetical protein PBI_MEGAN_72 [Microbacterium phage Megan]
MSVWSPPPSDASEHRAKTPFCGERGAQGRCDLYRGHYGPHKDSHTHAEWEVADEV